MRAYAREAEVALAAVRSASRAALSLQREIAATKAAYQKKDATGTGFGSVSPVTAADFMVQVRASHAKDTNEPAPALRASLKTITDARPSSSRAHAFTFPCVANAGPRPGKPLSRLPIG